MVNRNLIYIYMKSWLCFQEIHAEKRDTVSDQSRNIDPRGISSVEVEVMHLRFSFLTKELCSISLVIFCYQFKNLCLQ